MSEMRVRRARKVHYCDPGHRIEPGDLYIEHTGYPRDDNAYADYAGHPVRAAECRECAERYGRKELLDSYPCPHELVAVRKRFNNIGPDLACESVHIVSARCSACGVSLTGPYRKAAR